MKVLNKKFIYGLFLLGIWGLSCSPKSGTILNKEDIMGSEEYIVNMASTPIYINGKGNNAVWKEANVLTAFNLYWNDEDPLPTSFQALHDVENLYLLYRAHDPDLPSKLDTLKDIEAVHSDRVEIFFKGKVDSDPYYSLEMDCYGRLFDSEGMFGEYIDADWNWPKDDLDIRTHIFEDGYILECRISKKSLIDLGLIHNQKINAGVYRADYVFQEDGSRVPKWISWIDPGTPKPNFHIASSFGTLILK